MISGQTVDQVTSFKQLGVTVVYLLKWGDHTDVVTVKQLNVLVLKKN